MNVEEAILLSWVVAAVALVVVLRVFRRQPLANAPTRASSLSLPIVGGIIVAYWVVTLAVVLGAIAMGAMTWRDVVPPKAQPAAIAQSQTAPAASQAGGTLPATQPDSAVESLDRIMVMNDVSIIAYGITILPVLIILPSLFRDRFRGWGLHVRQIPKGVLWGLLGLVIVFPLLFAAEVGLNQIYLHFHYRAEEHTTFQALEQAPSLVQQVLLYGMAVVVAPVAEELFFRGILQTALIQYGWGLVMPQLLRPGMVPAAYRPTVLQRWMAIVLASAAFAYLHQLDAMPIIFLLALGLGYVYERTGVLWASIVLHMGFNSANLMLH